MSAENLQVLLGVVPINIQVEERARINDNRERARNKVRKSYCEEIDTPEYIALACPKWEDDMLLSIGGHLDAVP